MVRVWASQFYAAGPHPVQAVRSCSWPECVVMKCYNGRQFLGPRVDLGAHRDAVAKVEALPHQQGYSTLNAATRRLLKAQAIEGFLANAPNKTKLRLGLQQNFALVTAMIKAHPCLKTDFQVYLRNDGAVLNIDLDRCKRNTSGFVTHSDTDKSRLENGTMTLTTEPLSHLRLTCPPNFT